METSRPTVFVIEGDREERRSLRLLVASVGLDVEAFGSAEEFLASYAAGRPGCIIADDRLPGRSGLSLLEEAALGATAPVILVTGHAEVSRAVRAMKAGAFDFIEKPFSPQNLLDRVREAIELERRRRRAVADREAVRKRLDSLTPRERQVLDHLFEGATNRQIASALDISAKTVELHRKQVMTKLGAGSIAELVRLCVLATGDPPVAECRAGRTGAASAARPVGQRG